MHRVGERDKLSVKKYGSHTFVSRQKYPMQKISEWFGNR